MFSDSFAIFILIFGFTTCDKIDDAINDLTEIDIDTNLTESITVTLEDGVDKIFSEVENLKIDNPDTHEYLSNITDVKIISLTYRIASYNGDNKATATDVRFFADKKEMMKHDVITIADIDSFQVPDTTNFDAIVSKLKGGTAVEIGISGVSNSMGITNFVVEVTANVKITASANR